MIKSTIQYSALALASGSSRSRSSSPLGLDVDRPSSVSSAATEASYFSAESRLFHRAGTRPLGASALAFRMLERPTGPRIFVHMRPQGYPAATGRTLPHADPVRNDGKLTPSSCRWPASPAQGRS
jgi:hypothetical protein